MKYFSMFSGIGGFELGIQRAMDNWGATSTSALAEQRLQPNIDTGNGKRRWSDTTCVGYSEIDKYAIKVYERHFGKYESCNEHAHLSEKSKQEERPQGGEWSTNKHEIQLHTGNRTTPLCNRCKGHRNYGNATTINPDELPDFDLLVGGFPCQAFSIAGKRKGFDDTRGTLFFDIARILENKRPRHLVLENVKGLLSHDSGKTFQTILGVLSDLGYRVEWQILNSKDFGVPQNRERIFIIGHLRGECGRKVLPITGTNKKDTRIIGQDVAYAIDANYHKGTNTLEKSRRSIVQINQPNHSNDRVYATDGISPTLNTMQGGNRQPFVEQKPRIRRLTPKECERLQGFPETEESAIIEVCKQVNVSGAKKTSSTNDTDQDNAAQNSVLISCEENAVEIHSQGKLLWSANTVTNLNSSALSMPIGDFALAVAGIVRIVAKITQDGRAELAPNDKSLMVQVDGKNSVKIFGLEMTQLAKGAWLDTTTAKSSMKSITSSPLDLEITDTNLQTLFSYVMTAISGYIPEATFTNSTSTIQFKVKLGWTSGESDTQRYKMCGNAVTVNVIEAIMTNLVECLYEQRK